MCHPSVQLFFVFLHGLFGYVSRLRLILALWFCILQTAALIFKYMADGVVTEWQKGRCRLSWAYSIYMHICNTKCMIFKTDVRNKTPQLYASPLKINRISWSESTTWGKKKKESNRPGLTCGLWGLCSSRLVADRVQLLYTARSAQLTSSILDRHCTARPNSTAPQHCVTANDP